MQKGELGSFRRPRQPSSHVVMGWFGRHDGVSAFAPPRDPSDWLAFFLSFWLTGHVGEGKTMCACNSRTRGSRWKLGDGVALVTIASCGGCVVSAHHQRKQSHNKSSGGSHPSTNLSLPTALPRQIHKARGTSHCCFGILPTSSRRVCSSHMVSLPTTNPLSPIHN
ncbi:uncharacterized protein J3D65DRAFT_337547 [Phyllosticta citribraziliensis]|uniref:Uncharacterized protein n=1 Tax=Phyllosticta citribraziliensis TaxID=989973 RepID=A0ABR1LTW8_9PEZI